MREQPAPGHRRRKRGASCPSRGSSSSTGRHRPRFVRGRRLGRTSSRPPIAAASAPTAAHRVDAVSAGSTRTGRRRVDTTASALVLGPEVDQDRVGLPMCSARWPGGKSAAFRACRSRTSGPGHSANRRVNPLTLSSPSASTWVTSPTIGEPGTSRLADGPAEHRLARRQREGRRRRPVGGHAPQATRTAARSAIVRRGPGGAGSRRTPGARAARRVGAASPAAQQRAGRRRRARRSAGRASTERAERIDPARRRRRQRRSARRDRSTRTWHSTISPPAASTAGIIARSEPPVVRMSSTSRTRSPRRDREPAPELAPGRRRRRRGPPRRRCPASRAGGRSRRRGSRRRSSGRRRGRRAARPSRRGARRPRTPHSSLVAAGSWRTANFSR